MNGLDPEETRRTLERGQRVFTEVFGEPARGFLAPAWQRGHVRPGNENALGLDHVLGFFSLESWAGRKVPLATWTWDCGRWGWLGHVGHGIGWLSQSLDRGVPVLAIHPRDLERGFWPKILRLTEELVDSGLRTEHRGGLLEASDVEVDTRRRHGTPSGSADGAGARMAAGRGTRAGPRLGDRTPLGPVGAGAGTRGGHRRRERHSCRGTAAGPDRRRRPSVRRGTHTAALLVFMLRTRTTRPVSWRKRRASRAGPSSWCSRFIRIASVTRGFASGSSSGRSWPSTFRSSSATSLRRRSSP